MLIASWIACTGPVADTPAADTARDDTDPPAPADTDIDTGTEPEQQPVAPAVLLNEVQTRNDSTVMDPSGAFPDWVELYNASAETVPLSALSLSDKSGETWQGGEGQLAPGERVLLWADGSELPFELDSDGEQLTLAVDEVVTDRLATGQMAGDTAWARYPDGGAWAFTVRPTPGGSNGSHGGTSRDPSDTLFQTDRVVPIDLSVSQAGLDALEASPYDEVVGGIGVGGAWFPQVGVRKKGVYGSLRGNDAKVAFKVDLNAYADHHLRGQESLSLNNMVQDPTYVAELLTYTVFRAAGLPAPRVAYVRLSVNGEDWGLYALVESVDDVFLKRWYADPSGALYEGAYGVDFYVGHEELFEYDEGPDPDDRAALTEVAEVLEQEATDAAVAELEELVDLDAFLTNMAVEALILHWDGYTTANNYRVYDDPVTGRFGIIPWGTDQTFVDQGYYGPWDGYGRIFTFCLENAACAVRYDQALSETADLMDALPLAETVEELRTWLAEDLETDPRAEHSADTQAAYVETMLDTLATWPDEVREMIAE